MANYKNKILYIDPNNIAGHVSEGVNRDNITWKPEDLNFSVDIQVVVPNRDNCGKYDYTQYKEWLLYAKNKNSFFSGEPFGKDSNGKDKDFFLTNSYTNISYTEIKNSKQGNRELLGVESIDITFDSHFFPQVTIKFTDVRGASLMMPEEANYTNDKMNKKDESGSKEGYKNFFRSLFQFPYPVFYLTVKGYFGTRETFLLSVQDFKSTFNSESGNFDVTVKFIGHMFGVYSDLPLNYLIIAPYIGSTGNTPNQYWVKNSETGGSFTFADGKAIPTFIDFLFKFKKINTSFTEQLSIDGNFENVKKVTALRNLNEYLEEIIKYKDSYEKHLYSVFSSEANRMIFSNSNHIIVLKKTGGTINVPKQDYKSIILKYNEFLSRNGNLTIKGDDCLDFYKNIPDNSSKTVSYQELQLVNEDVSTVLGKNKISVFNGAEEDCALVFITEDMREAIRNGYSYAVVYRRYSNVGEFFDLIKTMIYEIEKTIQETIEEHFQEYNELATNVLGFSPTVENVFRMIYAHIDCFMHEFYGTLSNVEKQGISGKRLLSQIKPGVSYNEIDVKGTGDFSLPPYTGFYKKDVKTNLRVKKYPFEYRVNKENESLAEVSFIEKIYEGINGLSSIYEEIKPEENNAPILFEKHDFIPLTPLDVIYNGDNPYYCLNEAERQEFLNEIIKVFTHRVCVGLETNSFGWGKAENKPKHTSNVLDAIHNISEILTIPAVGIKGFLKEKGISYVINKVFKKAYETFNGVLVSEVETENILRALSLNSKKILFKELKDFYENNSPEDYNGLRKAIIKILDDPTLNFSFKDIAFKGYILNNTENNLVVKSYDIRKDINSENTGETKNVKVVKDYVHSRKLNQYTNLSESTIREYYTIERWNYWKTQTVNGIFRYNKNEDSYKGFEPKAYSDFVNNAVDGLIPQDEISMGIIQYGQYPTLKNLYFEKDYLKKVEEELVNEEEKSVIPYKRAQIFLSCLIGYNGKDFPYIDGNTKLLQMPKFIRLFLGSQVYFSQISINKDGVFNDFRKSADNLRGSNLGEIGIFYDTAMNEFTDWVKTDFEKINNLLEKYSTEEFSKKETIRDITVNNWYDAAKTFELQQALVNFYLSNDVVLNISDISEKKNNSVYFEIDEVLMLMTTLYAALSMDGEVNPEANTEGEDTIDDSENIGSEKDAERIKEEIYYTQKGLYDKWLSTLSVERFLLQAPDVDKDIAHKKSNGQKVNGKVTEYNSFVFMDSFYNDIGQTFFVDANILYRLLTEQIGEANIRRNRSVYEFISDIAWENKLLLVALPVYNNFYNKDTIKDIFTPHQIYDSSGSAGQREIGNTYLLMYTHEVSHNIDPGEDKENGVKFEDDGFDFADTLGEITQEAIDTFCGNDNLEKYTIPAFGVTYAKQNQSYFKSISLNMDNPRQTDFAIYNQFALAAQEAHGDVNSPVAVGQNMYSIYSNRAYDCHVEMMGCVNIMPMMYFQLNNIPLFKGAYMITKVEHHIKAGDMTTKFSGTRISKNAIPYLKCALNVEEIAKRLNGGVPEDEIQVNISGGNESSITITNPVIKEVPKVKLSKWFTLEELVHSDTADKNPAKYPEQYNIRQDIKDHLKELAHFLDGLRDYLGYALHINSGYRCSALNEELRRQKNGKKTEASLTSVHMKGWAADITPADTKVHPISEFKKQVSEYMSNPEIHYDQCILEGSNPGWVHIGLYNNNGKQRHDTFTITDN